MLLRYVHAEKIVLTYLDAMFGDKADILREHTIAKPYGWVFFYQSRRWIETRRTADAIIGGGPIFVNRFNIDVRHVTGAGTDLEQWLKAYESALPPRDLKPLAELPAQ